MARREEAGRKAYYNGEGLQTEGTTRRDDRQGAEVALFFLSPSRVEAWQRPRSRESSRRQA